MEAGKLEEEQRKVMLQEPGLELAHNELQGLDIKKELAFSQI